MRVDVGLVVSGVAVFGAAALQDVLPVTRLVPVKWPLLAAVALYYALTAPVWAALTVAVWAGMLADALGGLPQGGTCVFLALMCGAARLLGRSFAGAVAVKGVVLMALAAPLLLAWTWAWVGRAGALPSDMLRLAAAAAVAGPVAGSVVFAVLGRTERRLGIRGE